MAETPSDVQWPPGDGTLDFDSLFNALLRLKETHFSEHTARDLADPYIQIIVLMAALGQHAKGRVNHALNQLAPKTATSRSALVALMEIVNRPLRPISPARGTVYARLKATTHVAGTILVDSAQRIAPPSVQDPIFTVDADVLMPDSIVPAVSHEDYTASTETDLAAAWSVTFGQRDSLYISLDTLAFDSVSITLSTPLPGAISFSLEHYNEQAGEVDSVSNLGATLRFVLDSYLFKNESLAQPLYLSVILTHKPTGISETVEVSTGSGQLIAITGFLGQVSPSVAPSDYEVFAEWRPIRNAVDGTTGLTTSGSISFDLSEVFDEDALWSVDDTGKYVVRLRAISMAGSPDPSTLAASALSFDDNLWVVAPITQGVRTRASVGQTDGTKYQFLAAPTDPIDEPVANPAIVIEVGTDLSWTIADDFSNSDSTSHHALFIEDSDDGWGALFGDGALAELPTAGQTVRLTYRTGSTEPGNLDAGATIRAVGGLGLVDTWILFRGTDGYAPPEASDRVSALQFRHSILPQLALRADSAITRDEIVAAMTGGAVNRATFKTADGRMPFSRAFFSLEGAGDRQYRVIVVGSESVADGSVLTTDLAEAEVWLNGTEVGVEVIGGHGPNNTQAIVTSFTSRPLLPTITVSISNPAGVQDIVDLVVRNFFKPHSRDKDQAFRWSVGGRVPMAILFGLLWEALPSRTFITISVNDGTTLYDAGDFVQLLDTELPILDPTYVKTVNILTVAP